MLRGQPHQSLSTAGCQIDPLPPKLLQNVLHAHTCHKTRYKELNRIPTQPPSTHPRSFPNDYVFAGNSNLRKLLLIKDTTLTSPPPTSPIPPQLTTLERRELLGFRDGEKSTHSSRTLMLAELDLLLTHATPTTSITEYQRLIVEENVLGKATNTTREYSFWKLKALYGLEPDIPVFRTLAQLWPNDEESRPLLALLAAHARDPLVRLVTPTILDLPIGAVVPRADIEDIIHQTLPGRFSKPVSEATTRRLLSTFTQSGHLEGRTTKTRIQPTAPPVSATYAFYLAYIEGYRSQRIFTSIWSKLLDVHDAQLPELAKTAAQYGLMDYHQVGNVIELRFPNFLSIQEEELTREQ